MKQNEVKWQGKVFATIIEFDGRIVNLETKEEGRYFTVIPISPAQYRKAHPDMPSCAKIRPLKNTTKFIIVSDHGSEYVLEVPNAAKSVINLIKQNLIRNELLKEQR